MTYNDLLNGFPGATYSLLKEYEAGSAPGYVLVEIHHRDFYTCFMFDKSFSYCLFSKYKSELLLEQEAKMKANNPEFYAFANDILRPIFGH